MLINEQQRAEALALCALLRASLRTLGTWSLCLSMLAVAVGLYSQTASQAVTALWALVLLSGLMERYVAVRLALDEQLFHQLGHGRMPSLQALDDSLARLGLLKSPLTVRPWGDRLSGTRSLLRRHVFLVLLQTAAALVSLFF